MLYLTEPMLLLHLPTQEYQIVKKSARSLSTVQVESPWRLAQPSIISNIVLMKGQGKVSACGSLRALWTGKPCEAMWNNDLRSRPFRFAYEKHVLKISPFLIFTCIIWAAAFVYCYLNVKSFVSFVFLLVVSALLNLMLSDCNVLYPILNFTL